jgi:hypothetical protein
MMEATSDLMPLHCGRTPLQNVNRDGVRSHRTSSGNSKTRGSAATSGRSAPVHAALILPTFLHPGPGLNADTEKLLPANSSVSQSESKAVVATTFVVAQVVALAASSLPSLALALAWPSQ